MAKLIAVCLALAGLSLLLPSEPSYDPWAWLVWGRELAHLGLDTTGGPSWKPLPVAFTTVVARLEGVNEGLPAALWMVVARAGALLAVALAFRLAFRLAGGGLAGGLGGAVAAVAVCLMPDWLQFVAHGSEAPMAVAFVLWAVERHLDRRHAHVLVLGTLACLLRPELFPFLAIYAGSTWWTQPRLRPLVAAVVVLLPLAWIVPEWLGSGNPLDGGKQARSEPVWSLSHADQPWLRALERAHNHAGVAVELLALVAVAAALVWRRWAVAALGAGALAGMALYVGMTEAGFSGNPRYVLPALAVASALAGGRAARGRGARLRDGQPRPPLPARLGAASADRPGRERDRSPGRLPLLARGPERGCLRSRPSRDARDIGQGREHSRVPAGRAHVPVGSPRVGSNRRALYRTFAGGLQRRG